MTPWWLTSLSSLAISVVVFGLGYFLVYRRQLGPQLRHLNGQITDREATLMAREAPEALEFAKAVQLWGKGALDDREHPKSGWQTLPSPVAVGDAARLANDSTLRRLLERMAGVLPAAHSAPAMWVNVALQINRDPELMARLGAVMSTHPLVLTPAQEAFLASDRAEWERARDLWAVAAAKLLTIADEMRDHAETLLRAAP